MKNLEDLYKEILADQELKAKCGEAIKAQKLEEFLKAHECEATMEDVKAFMESKKEVSPDGLDILAGGSGRPLSSVHVHIESRRHMCNIL